MSRQVVINKLCDWTGAAATDTFELTVDDVTYTTDLSHQQAAQLRKALKPYLAKAFGRRKAGTPPPTSKGKAKPKGVANKSTNKASKSRLQATSGPDQAAIRAWGLANGYTVKPIGNVPQAVRNAYYANRSEGTAETA